MKVLTDSFDVFEKTFRISSVMITLRSRGVHWTAVNSVYNNTSIVSMRDWAFNF